MFRICFDLYVLNFRKTWLKYVNFQWIVALLKDFVTAQSPRNSSYGTWKKLKKKQRFQNCSLSMYCRKHVMFFLFFYFFFNFYFYFFFFLGGGGEIWGLIPSFFGTPFRSHYSISSPQIMQKNCLTYCFVKRQKYLRDSIYLAIHLFVCLIDLILYVPSPIFQLNRDGSPCVEPVLS